MYQRNLATGIENQQVKEHADHIDVDIKTRRERWTVVLNVV